MLFKRKNWQIRKYDLGISAFALFAGTVICIFLRDFSENEIYVALVFVLCVMIVSLKTEGYFCGTMMSLVSVLAVNYVFTYPYMKLNFSISGYPLTFVTMLTVSLITCTLTTNLKQEEKLRMENERERMRANLLRAISHDLRTPLTGISGAVNYVLDSSTLTREQERELLSGVRDDANWLIRMVENLLSVTRIGLDEAKVEKTVEPAEEVLFAAVSKFRKRFPDVQVETAITDEIVFVPMDPVLIEQVISNLMENAAIHGESTHIQVKMETKREMAVFTIKDNGCGIAPHVLPHLFDDYYMLAEKSKGTGKRRSMGIGLSVCKSIVKAHSGTVNAYNHAEGGACFSFSLPVSREIENYGNS